jgi:TPR repeat protein
VALIVFFVAACGLSRSTGVADWEAGRARLRGELDLADAAAAFERVCGAGHTQACGSLALQLQDGRGVPHDPQRAMVLYQQACDQGIGVACMNLGLMLDGGVWADLDPARAAGLFILAEKHYKSACEGGDLQWCPNLGTMYELGLGVPKDLDRASAVYRTACDRGHATSCANLGLVLRERGDAAGALALLEQGCVPESPLACGLLGQLLVKDGLDAKRGITLLEVACTAGERDPCSVLAGVYGVGLGVPEDLARATT